MMVRMPERRSSAADLSLGVGGLAAAVLQIGLWRT